MKIPFYQTVWNKVDLINLAHELGHPLNKLPTNQFYEAYYDNFLSNQKTFEHEWKASKRIQTDWLRCQIDSLVDKDLPVLSVGAGTGIIEQPLIQAGYNIHLQEFQKKSLEIFGASALTTCHYTDLSEIIDEQYGMIVTIAMTYALDETALRAFFASCNKLLTKNGILVILDTSLSWKEIYSYIRNKKYYENNHLLWGYKRGISNYSKLTFNFILDSYEFYNEEMQKIQPITFRGIPLNIVPCWQMMVFKKND